MKWRFDPILVPRCCCLHFSCFGNNIPWKTMRLIEMHLSMYIFREYCYRVEPDTFRVRWGGSSGGLECARGIRNGGMFSYVGR